MKRTHIKAILLAALALGFSACGNSSEHAESSGADETARTAQTEASLPVLLENPASQKMNFNFLMKNVSQSDTAVNYELLAQYNGDTVGFNLQVSKLIEAGITKDGTPDEELGFTEGKIQLSSMGEASDNFVKVLSDVFALPSSGEMRDSVIAPLVFSSNRTAVEVEKNATYSFKYFFDNPTGRAAELFGVIDTYRRSFTLTEKDNSFRREIIASFQKD